MTRVEARLHAGTLVEMTRAAVPICTVVFKKARGRTLLEIAVHHLEADSNADPEMLEVLFTLPHSRHQSTNHTSTLFATGHFAEGAEGEAYHNMNQTSSFRGQTQAEMAAVDNRRAQGDLGH